MTLNEKLFEKHRRREAEEALVKELRDYLDRNAEFRKNDAANKQFARNLYLVATGGGIGPGDLTPEATALSAIVAEPSPYHLFMAAWKHVVLEKVKKFCTKKVGRRSKLDRDQFNYILAKLYEERFHTGVFSEIWYKRRQEDAGLEQYQEAA